LESGIIVLGHLFTSAAVVLAHYPLCIIHFALGWSTQMKVGGGAIPTTTTLIKDVEFCENNVEL
jgi:hypothetical protein